MSTKRLLILGATGGTGLQILLQALQQGHEVTVFVRSPQKLTVVHDHLRIVRGDVTRDREALADSVRGQDAVISALGVGTSLKSGGLISSSMKSIVGAMESEGVRRLIFVSAYGVGATRIDVPLLPRLLMRLLLRDVYQDKAAAEEDLRRSRLDWTLVYPTTLTNGPATGRCRTGERLALRGFPRVARADVARFILTQVADATFIGKGVLISS